MTNPQTFAAFIAPWRQTFPALALAELFASVGEAPTLLARAVLLFDGCDAVWRVSDARVGIARLGWWAEEWSAIQSGRGSHPLVGPLQVGTGAAPVAALWRELDAPSVADAAERLAGYDAIADEFALAFHAADSSHCAGFRHLALALIIGRHVAALRAGHSAAVAALPRDWRARHQLQTDADWLAGAPGQAAAHSASLDLAGLAAERLQRSLRAVPEASWPGQRGARVLAALALRELRDMGRPNGALTRYRDLFRAWRVATATAR